MRCTPIWRLLFALMLLVSTQQARAQEFSGTAVPDVDMEVPDQEAEPAEPRGGKSAQSKAVQIKALVARSEAARRRGDVQAQIAELRRAHDLAEGKHSNVVALLASALRVTGELDEPRQLREAIVATGLKPADLFTHVTVLSEYASGTGDFATARKWRGIAENRHVSDPTIGRHIAR